MPDIIQQLEAGKKMQEEEGIDAASLRTKIGSDEEEPQKEKKKRGRKKKEEPVEQQEQPPVTDEDPFAQAERMMKENETKEEVPKDVENPEFDFNDYYEKGQEIFYIKINKVLGTKDFYALKIRTIYPRMIVACEEGKAVQCIGYDTKDKIFTSRSIARQEYNKIEISPRFTPKLKLEEEVEEENEESKDTDS